MDIVVETITEITSIEYLTFAKEMLFFSENSRQKLSIGNVILAKLIIMPTDKPLIIVPRITRSILRV